jgi:hypothetical protein
MLRRTLLVLLFLTSLVAAFGAGSLTAIRLDWGKPLAVITVENQSGKTISSVEIVLTTCGTQRTISQRSTDIQAHASQSAIHMFKVPLCGEGGHRTRVQFSDGKTVESPGSYIMNGSRIVEQVKADSIRSEVTSLLY